MRWDLRIRYIVCTPTDHRMYAPQPTVEAMSLFNKADRNFLEALSRVAYANPFSPERIELEKAALGSEFSPEQAGVWSRHADIDAIRTNVQRLAGRGRTIIDKARTSLTKEVAATPDELLLYEDASLYLLYDQFRSELQEASERAFQKSSQAKIAFWPKFQEAFQHYFSIPGVQLPSDCQAEHIFACFFQIRRAFYHIFDFIVGQSAPTVRLRAAVWQSIFTHNLRRYQRSLYRQMSDMTTLICGPSGTGKELVARAVGLSRYIPFDQQKQTFVSDFTGSLHSLNLSAMSPTLIESDLFGHSKGAFTGATAARVGWLEVCEPYGTVFLDEIGELEPAIQVKLLRVVQNRTFSRLGETEIRTFQGKLIAATNRDLAEEMQAGRFREDLYYRLCSDLITTSSLHEQLADTPDDLHNLIMFVAKRIAGQDAEQLTLEVEHWITNHLGLDYRWPGNIRELEQCVRNCLVRGEYHPRLAHASSTYSSNDWLQQAEDRALTADELLNHYSLWVYNQLGTYEATAERLELDRRTVKRRITEVRK